MKNNIRKLSESFQHAFRGLGLCIHGERNFRVHMTAAFYVTVFALLGGADASAAAALCLCFGLTHGRGADEHPPSSACATVRPAGMTALSATQRTSRPPAWSCAQPRAWRWACAFFCLKACCSARLAWLAAHLWAAALLLLSVPAALWFIFKYGRIQ